MISGGMGSLVTDSVPLSEASVVRRRVRVAGWGFVSFMTTNTNRASASFHEVCIQIAQLVHKLDHANRTACAKRLCSYVISFGGHMYQCTRCRKTFMERSAQCKCGAWNSQKEVDLTPGPQIIGGQENDETIAAPITSL